MALLQNISCLLQNLPSLLSASLAKILLKYSLMPLLAMIVRLVRLLFVSHNIVDLLFLIITSDLTVQVRAGAPGPRVARAAHATCGSAATSTWSTRRTRGTPPRPRPWPTPRHATTSGRGPAPRARAWPCCRSTSGAAATLQVSWPLIGCARVT